MKKNKLKTQTLMIQAKKMALLFLSGFALGVFLITMGWAASKPAHPKKHPAAKTAKHQKVAAKKAAVKKVAAKKAKTKPIASAKVHAKPQAKKVKYQLSMHRLIKDPVMVPAQARVYQHPSGLYKFRYPQGWQINEKNSAMVAKGPNDIGVFGIIRRPDDQPNEEAVRKEFNASNRPADLIQTPSRIAGMKATKLIGSKKDDPYTRVVEYYVQHRNGHQYYILMMAPTSEWNRYTSTFGSMLNSLTLN